MLLLKNVIILIALCVISITSFAVEPQQCDPTKAKCDTICYGNYIYSGGYQRTGIVIDNQEYTVPYGDNPAKFLVPHNDSGHYTTFTWSKHGVSSSETIPGVVDNEKHDLSHVPPIHDIILTNDPRGCPSPI